MKVKTDVSNIPLISLNNYCMDKGIDLPLECVDGKVYGIIMEVKC